MRASDWRILKARRAMGYGNHLVLALFKHVGHQHAQACFIIDDKHRLAVAGVERRSAARFVFFQQFAGEAGEDKGTRSCPCRVQNRFST